jgi:hypothetical protein
MLVLPIVHALAMVSARVVARGGPAVIPVRGHDGGAERGGREKCGNGERGASDHRTSSWAGHWPAPYKPGLAPQQRPRFILKRQR